MDTACLTIIIGGLIIGVGAIAFTIIACIVGVPYRWMLKPKPDDDLSTHHTCSTSKTKYRDTTDQDAAAISTMTTINML